MSASSSKSSLQPPNNATEFTKGDRTDSLVRYLLNAKRSLTSIDHVRRAEQLCASTRHAIEQSALHSAQSSYLSQGVSSQLAVLDDVHHGLNATARRTQNEYATIAADLQDAHDRLKATLQELRDTIVEAKLRPEEEERRDLSSFIDEQSVNDALAGTQAMTKSREADLAIFDKSCAGFQARLAALRKSLKTLGSSSGRTQQPAFPLSEIIQVMEDHAREMAVNLESLVSHFDLCVTAIKHQEGGGGDVVSRIAGDLPDGVDIGNVPQDVQPLSAEEQGNLMSVLEEDAGQVDDVVTDIRQRLTAMEDLAARVAGDTAILQKSKMSAFEMFQSLETIGKELPSLLSQKQAFQRQWQEDKSKLVEKVEELEGLREFYQDYARAYDSLIIEVGRRKAMEVRMDRLIEETGARIAKLYSEDLKERDLFKRQHGDFLPVDIWPGLMNAPVEYNILPVDSAAERVPDISKSAIHRAIRRVHGSI